MMFGSKEFNDAMDQFRIGKTWLNGVSIDIEGGENDIDALVLLRAYDAEPTVDNSLALAAQFIMNKHVVFNKDGKQIFALTYTGGDLSVPFKKCPYLLDLLLKMSYGLLVKKLTPPSEDSETEERQSE